MGEGWGFFCFCFVLKTLFSKIHTRNNLSYARSPSEVSRLIYGLKKNIQSRKKN